MSPRDPAKTEPTVAIRPGRILSVVAIAAALLMVLGAPASAQTYPSTGSATFSDPTPDAGQTFTVSGTTTPNTTVSVVMVNGGVSTTLGSVTSNSLGEYVLSIGIPADADGSVVLSVVAGVQVLGSTSYNLGTSTGSGTGSGGQAAASQSGALPLTGSNAPLVLALAAGLLVAGGFLVVAANRALRS